MVVKNPAQQSLINLHHAMEGAKHVHILICKGKDASSVQKQWPAHIVVVLPGVADNMGAGNTRCGVPHFNKGWSFSFIICKFFTLLSKFDCHFKFFMEKYWTSKLFVDWVLFLRDNFIWKSFIQTVAGLTGTNKAPASKERSNPSILTVLFSVYLCTIVYYISLFNRASLHLLILSSLNSGSFITIRS